MTSLSRPFVSLLLVITINLSCVYAQSQATTAALTGTVKDEGGVAVAGATITLKDQQTNFERAITTDAEGVYRFSGIPPGDYQIVVVASGFARLTNEEVVLALGQTARIDLTLIASSLVQEEIVAKARSEIIEATKTAVTQTIDERRIQNLPINGRDFINFSLTNSQVGRDTSAAIASAPTTGLSFGGQNTRSNLVQVDGADNIDNTVNTVRSTVSQEAVQEFQVIINGYSAEFGRSDGGVVNIVTRSGGNELHGRAFGFIRHRSIQARNALAFPPAGGDEKPAFTRGQYGFTLGGPVRKDRTFFFLSLDQTRRHESGFSQIGLDPTIFDLTPAQQAYLAANAGTIGAGIYRQLATSGAAVARSGIDPITGQPIFYSTFLASQGRVLARIPASFRVLTRTENVYPVSDEFTFYLVKIDHQLTADNNLSVRYTFTPATAQGVQSSEGEQSLGLNDRSRGSTISTRDTSLVVRDLQTFGANVANEFVFNFGRRGAGVLPSQDVGINISGTALFGTSAFSPAVERIERRYELKDTLSYTRGDHAFDFGVDINRIVAPVRRAELTFAGLFSFGELPVAANPLFAGAPPLTPVQAYGLGLPQAFVQSFGQSSSRLTNTTIALFAQDSWNVRPAVTFNYGVRYETQLTPTFEPTGITTAGLTISAQQIDAGERRLNVIQGLPRDYNNVAARLGVAWDVRGDGATVMRVAYGLFYDNPVLGNAFAADIADGVQSPQLITIGGAGVPTMPLNAAQVFQGTVVPGVTPGVDAAAVYLPGESRFNSAAAFPGYGSFLPTTVPVDRDFVVAYSQQASLSIERVLDKETSLAVTYLFSGGRKLARQSERNRPNAALVLASGGVNSVTIANNFFRPSGPNPVLVRTDEPVPFGSVLVQESSGSSVYHALSLNLNRRFANGFQALASYTLSKTLSNPSTVQESSRPGDDRARSSLDQRQRFVLSAIYRTPFRQRDGRGLKLLLADTTIATIVELSAGRPFNILTGVDTNLDLTNQTDRPDVDARGQLSLPQPGRAGTLSRNAGTTPGFASVDLRLARALSFGERVKVELIAEVFNLLNRVNVATVNTNFRFVRFDHGRFTSSATSVLDPRQFQFAMKVNF